MVTVVRMLTDVSGTRNLVDWPDVQGTKSLPDAEAADLVASGIAELDV